MQQFFLFSIFIVIIFFISQTESKNDRVLLRDVTSITLKRGEYTAGRRSKSIPQLECVGGTAYGSYSPKIVQCYNRGFDGVDVQWECKAQMNSDYEFGKIDVSCEGYDYPEDPYILAGSCGLRYELDYTSSGAKRKSYSPTRSTEGIDVVKIVYFVIACFVIYLIYTTLTAPRQGHEGDRSRGSGSGFDHGPGYPPGGGNPPPPGWRDPPPSYSDSAKYSNYGTGSTAGASSSGPGFFTGMGLGALGGYLFGNRNSGYYGDGAYRRRNYFGASQFDQDTGFYDQPSTSYFNSRDEPSSSSTHTSSGFGGTSRR